MKQFSTALLASITILLPVPFLQAQDTIVLNNGREIEGVILSEVGERVRIRTISGEYSVPLSTVREVRRGTESENMIAEFENSLRMGDFSGAWEAWDEALEDDGLSTESLRPYWTTYFENLIRTVPAQPLALRGEINRQLDSLNRTYGDSERFAWNCSRLYFGIGNIEQALESSKQVRVETLKNDDELKASAMLYLPVLAENLYQNEFLGGAIQSIEKLVEIDPEYGSSQQVLLALYSSAAARRNEDFESALQIIRRDIQPSMPFLARNRLDLTTELLINKASNERTEEDARSLVDRYIEAIEPSLARQTNIRLGVAEMERLVREQKYPDAVGLGLELRRRFENAVVDRYYQKALYHVEYMEIDRENPLDLLELAMKSRENNLHQEALDLLYEVRENESVRKLAETQIDLIEKERDLEVLQRALDAFDKGNLNLVIDICNEIEMDEGRMSPQLDEIQQLSDTAKREVNLRAKARPYQAEAYYQEAERSWFMGEIDESWYLVQLILKEYSDTPAAQRAMNLMNDLETADKIREFEKPRFGVLQDEYDEKRAAEKVVKAEEENETDPDSPLRMEIARLIESINQQGF